MLKKTGMVLLAALICAAVPSVVAVADEALAEGGGQVVVVTHGTDVDTVNVGTAHRQRVCELLTEISEQHRIECEIVTVSRANTGYDNDVYFARRMTVVDAEGRRDGQEMYFSNWYQGPYRVAQYRQGVAQGMERHYTPNGQTLQAEIPWEDGQIHGMRQVFHPEGSIRTQTPYVRGVIDGDSLTFDTQGRVLRKVQFENGRRHGESLDYWPENPAQLQRIIHYIDGQVHGLARAYYLDGKLHWERPFVDNQLHGVERHFDGDGQQIRVIHWLANEQVSEAAWKAAAGTP